jgi:hypothetical protein
MNRSSVLIIFIFLVGMLTGYSLHESKEKIEIHQEALNIFNEYQENKIKNYNFTTQYNISGIDINE